jgi:hypothetical protein
MDDKTPDSTRAFLVSGPGVGGERRPVAGDDPA